MYVCENGINDYYRNGYFRSVGRSDVEFEAKLVIYVYNEEHSIRSSPNLFRGVEE